MKKNGLIFNYGLKPWSFKSHRKTKIIDTQLFSLYLLDKYLQGSQMTQRLIWL